jgi:hypothetical protein
MTYLYFVAISQADSVEIIIHSKKLLGSINSNHCGLCIYLASAKGIVMRGKLRYLEEPIGYPAHTGFITLSVHPSVCLSVYPEYKNM